MLQREGQGGLEVCPGREASTDFGVGNDWTPVVPRNDAITINIGDLLMRWCGSEPHTCPLQLHRLIGALAVFLLHSSSVVPQLIKTVY